MIKFNEGCYSQHYHLARIKYHGPTNYKPSRLSVDCPRIGKRAMISYSLCNSSTNAHFEALGLYLKRLLTAEQLEALELSDLIRISDETSHDTMIGISGEFFLRLERHGMPIEFPN